MPLTCHYDWDPESGDICWDTPGEYELLSTSRRQRCCSCNTLIALETIVCSVERWKIPEYEVEVAIYGEDGLVPRSNKFLCEECADLYFSLSELGFCVMPYENQKELVKEYAEGTSRNKTAT